MLQPESPEILHEEGAADEQRHANAGIAEMAGYSLWRTGPGPVTMSIRPFGMVEANTWLALMKAGIKPAFTATTIGGIDDYQIDAATVALLRAAPTSAQPPYLFLQCGGLLNPAGPALGRWGWGTRFTREGVVLPCVDENGAARPLDAQGFCLTSRTIPAGKKGVVGLDLITLS